LDRIFTNNEWSLIDNRVKNGYTKLSKLKRKSENKMSKLLITTQISENYGAHNWDGKGACPQWWKNKGGKDYVVLGVDINNPAGALASVQSQCETNDDYFVEKVLGWEVVSDDYLTDYERDQLAFDGKIMYSAKQLVA
jgi:hypothetical protein